MIMRLVHDFYPSQDLTHLGVVAPQTQFRTDELLEAIQALLQIVGGDKLIIPFC